MLAGIGKIVLGFASKVVVSRALDAFKDLSKRGHKLDEDMVINYLNKHIDLPRANEKQEKELMHHSYGLAKVLYEISQNKEVS